MMFTRRLINKLRIKIWSLRPIPIFFTDSFKVSIPFFSQFTNAKRFPWFKLVLGSFQTAIENCFTMCISFALLENVSVWSLVNSGEFFYNVSIAVLSISRRLNNSSHVFTELFAKYRRVSKIISL